MSSKAVKNIAILSGITAILVAGGKLFANTVNNFSHYVKFNIPFNKINMKISLLNTVVTAALEVKNNFYHNITVEGINMTVYMKNVKTGTFIEVASTQPSTKQYIIARNATTNINDIKVDISNYAVISTGISALTNYQKGSKNFKVIISCYANGIPFETETLY